MQNKLFWLMTLQQKNSNKNANNLITAEKCSFIHRQTSGFRTITQSNSALWYTCRCSRNSMMLLNIVLPEGILKTNMH